MQQSQQRKVTHTCKRWLTLPSTGDSWLATSATSQSAAAMKQTNCHDGRVTWGRAGWSLFTCASTGWSKHCSIFVFTFLISRVLYKNKQRSVHTITYTHKHTERTHPWATDIFLQMYRVCTWDSRLWYKKHTRTDRVLWRNRLTCSIHNYAILIAHTVITLQNA